MKDIHKEEWKKLIAEDANAIILDVRTPGEWMEGVQPNAVLMNIMNTAEFLQKADSLDKTKNYYIYCRSGGRSGQACMMLGAKGFNTFNLIGGMMSWDGEVVEMQ